MGNRVFFKKSIAQLEELFSNSRDDRVALTKILEELGHRKTQRAKELQRAIEEMVNASAPPIPDREPEGQVASTPDEPPVKLDSNGVRMPSLIDDWAEAIRQSNDGLPAGEPLPEETANTPLEILESWTALEALSPQSYRRPQDLCIGDGAVMPLLVEPWNLGLKSKPKHQLYFHVYLGAVKVGESTQALLKHFGDERSEKPSTGGFASLGILVVDRYGKPLSEQSLAISSFGWAYGQVLHGDIDRLRYWERAEPVILGALRKIFFVEDEDGEVQPLTVAQIQTAHQWLTRSYGLPADHCLPPEFAIKIFHRFGLGDPEPPLLNSFYIEDLQRAKSTLEQGGAGKALAGYLGMETPSQQLNLLKDHDAVMDVLAPRNTPLGRWPSNGRHSLVHLQQLAVNLSQSELKDSGIAAVNGPPGTGKTTLLRDLVASIVVGRAKQMCEFDRPESAFKHSGSMKVNQAHLHLYELDERLRGHEILVASSNNKAVENISKELPLLESIDGSLPPPEYFRTTSDAVAGTEGSTWGLVAAALGNSSNRFSFVSKAWWDRDSSLMTYFKSIVGAPTGREDGEQSLPKVLTEQDPPDNPAVALERWKKQRATFIAACQKVEAAISIAQQAHDDLRSLEPLTEKVSQLETASDQLAQEHQKIEVEYDIASEAVRDAKEIVGRSSQNEQSLLAMRPGFFARLFRSQSWRSWQNDFSSVAQEAIRDRKHLGECEQRFVGVSKALHEAAQKKEQATHGLGEGRQLLTDTWKRIDEATPVTGGRLLDRDFWELPHGEIQMHIPNFADEIQHLRDTVFREAFNLHKAFLDAAAKPVRHNIGALFACFSGYSLPEQKEPLLLSLWSTFFCLVPVVSTTFASVGRMLKKLPDDSLGWVLIDEAGQATPQAAVGAIMRSRRAFVVGDPLQIEPVVPLPLPLVEKVAQYFSVDAKDWCAPFSSAQSLADRSSKYGARIKHDAGEMQIGAPLLVHRRCEEPMFSMSNKLAYGGFMVKATCERESSVREVLGDSQWIDVRGDAKDKWCPEEGEVVVNMLKDVSSALSEIPDLFIITPFRIVAENMRKRLRDEQRLFERYSEDLNSWVNNRVGTVHTFQGKEAEAVILLLGATSSQQDGARAWATNQVNLLNVAVSRAKQALYVVGNQNAWGNKNNMKIVSSKLANPSSERTPQSHSEAFRRVATAEENSERAYFDIDEAQADLAKISEASGTRR